jgi:NAD+ diphosphatase
VSTLGSFAFAHGALDRASERRGNAEWLTGAIDHPDARVVLVREDGAVLSREGAPLALAAAQLETDERLRVSLLGVQDQVPLFVLAQERARADALAVRFDAVHLDMRTLAASAPPPDAGLAAFARALVHWQSRKRYCGRCGAPTRLTLAGHRAECTEPSCAQQYFPRTDPAVIVIVHRGTRCLLGRQPGWPARRYSTLAGFVEPGETLEQAVTREVAEESGVQAGNCRYLASQPWPFPASLMLGFEAEATTEAISLDGELEEARWFEAEELHDSGQILLSPGISIAFHLIDAWQRRHTGRPLTPGPNWKSRG